jgi:hypothetical protein
MDILDALVDLQKQATTERSHHYVAKCCARAIAEVVSLRLRLIIDGAPAELHKPMRIEHDGFEGVVIGEYTTLEGKQGLVLQQAGTKIVHVYGKQWCKEIT